MVRYLNKIGIRSKSAPIPLWLALLMIYITGLSLKVYWDIQAHQIERKYQASVQASEKRYLSLERLTLPQQMGNKSPTQVQATIGAAKPLDLQPYGSDFHARWIDPSSQAEVFLYFNDQQLFTGRKIHWTHQYVPWPGTRSEQLADAIDHFNQSLSLTDHSGVSISFAYFVWPIALIWYLKNVRRRRWRAYILICFVVSCPLAWLMSSPSLLTLEGIVNIDFNVFGLVMLIFSVIALAIGGVRDRISDPFSCKNCGYNLKGNQTGACSECGAVVPQTQKEL